MIENSQSNKAKEDHLLVLRVLDGDESAFALLMLRYKESIYFMLLKMVNNKDDAEDLTIEAFGKAFANLHHFSSDYAFSTWLYKIATNNCIDFLRKKKGVHYPIDQNSDYETAENSLKLQSQNPNPEERLIIKQRARSMHSFIKRLKPNYQKLIHLRYFKEYTYEEIAKELDLPLGTVKVQLFRARNVLYELISKTDVKE